MVDLEEVSGPFRMTLDSVGCMSKFTALECENARRRPRFGKTLEGGLTASIMHFSIADLKPQSPFLKSEPGNSVFSEASDLQLIIPPKSPNHSCEGWVTNLAQGGFGCPRCDTGPLGVTAESRRDVQHV